MLDTTDPTLALLREREAELEIQHRVMAGVLAELRELIAASSSRRVRKPRQAREAVPETRSSRDAAAPFAASDPARHRLDAALASLGRAVAERDEVDADPDLAEAA